MHRKLFAFVFVAALLFSAVGVIADSDSSDASSVTTITGYVGMAGTPNTAAEGMEINLNNTSESLSPLTTTVGADGVFTFTLTGDYVGMDVFHLYFTDVDYLAQSMPEKVTRITGNSHLQLDLTGVTSTSYQLGSDLDHGILLILGQENLEFTVKGTDRFLRNAMINLEDDDSHQEFSGETGDNGKYVFTNLPYGVYNLKVTCNGYKAWYEQITVNGQATHSVTMIEKEIPTFYGMTTYHALMLVGVAAGLILFTISYIMVRRNSKGIKD